MITRHWATALMGAVIVAPAYAEENDREIRKLDEVTVTATREERTTREVPASISVIDSKRIDESRMFNITDALSGTPGVQINTKNGGYDARMIIRGAGLKANYGIREIMMLRDGVPLTDPDSFTKLDFIDTQDIERIEVTKGPGNIYALGSAGGTIQIISKSVFDEENSFKVGAGDNRTENMHVRVGDSFGEDNSQALALSVSRRSTDNNWRHWNNFSSSQYGVKYGNMLSGDSVFESELSYTRSDLQLPGDMNETQFNQFLNTGVQTDNNSAFKHSGRYSENLFFNSRLEKQLGDYTFKPRVYVNIWSHLHPVTGRINDTNGVTTIGTDLEFSHEHKLWGDDTLVAGLTLKQDRNKDDKKYKYRDVQTIPGGRIVATLSDAKGDLIETQSETNTVAGIFAQESLRPSDRVLVDAGFRVDRINLKQDANEIETFDFATGTYVPGAGITHRDRDFTLVSVNTGVSYKLTDTISTFATLAQGEQVPFASELDQNPDLNASTSRNHEVGLKGRAEEWQFDTSIYYINTSDEVIGIWDGAQTVYQNAGETDKKGLEFSGSVRLLGGAKNNNELWLGASYAYSDYKYKKFNEVVYGTPVDRSGNQLPYIPEHQYSVFVTYAHSSGVKVRLQSDTWGEYYVDNANTEKYDGYDFITSMNVAYGKGPHEISFNVQNITDERYAVEVKKSTSGAKSYTPGAPRNYLLTYRYKFN